MLRVPQRLRRTVRQTDRRTDVRTDKRSNGRTTYDSNTSLTMRLNYTELLWAHEHFETKHVVQGSLLA